MSARDLCNSLNLQRLTLTAVRSMAIVRLDGIPVSLRDHPWHALALLLEPAGGSCLRPKAI
jgi:hypothetical protein